MNRTATLLAAFALAAPLRAQSQPAGPPPDFDRYVVEVLAAFRVPGAAVTIVKDGRVVLAKGYGIKTLGRPDPVDAHTLFGIGSNTKVFTATALGLLAQEGKIGWDVPVITYLPSFRMSDPYITAELTVRDLLVHRSGLGLGAGDLLWWPGSDYDRKEVVRRLRYLPLSTSFRSAYAYDNVLYNVAGELIEAVTGQTWEQFVAARILRPLGMTETSVRYPSGPAGANVATTHAEVDGTVRAVTPFANDNVNPAGGIHSNATDMAKWVMVQLDSGRVSGAEPLFRPGLTREIQTIVTPEPIGRVPRELAALQPNFLGYGLGENVLDYRGTKLVSHTGGLPGYLSRVAMIPSLRLGVVVLTNQESGEAFDAITNRVLDHYLGTTFDWLAGYRKTAERNAAQIAEAERRTAAARVPAGKPSLPLERYAGTYRDAWYGDVIVTADNGKLKIRFGHTPLLSGELEHWQFDTFVARWTSRELRADAFVTFALDADGNVDQAKLRAFSPITDFSFDFQDLLLRPVRTP